MTVRDMKVTLEDFDDDMEVRFLLEQHRTNLQYGICDAEVAGDDEHGGEAVYLTGTHEEYGPRL